MVTQRLTAANLGHRYFVVRANARITFFLAFGGDG
jgi:hypothetical protein